MKIPSSSAQGVAWSGRPNQQQQMDFRSRWNSYSQTLQENLNPPEGETEKTGASLSFIR